MSEKSKNQEMAPMPEFTGMGATSNSWIKCLNYHVDSPTSVIVNQQ